MASSNGDNTTPESGAEIRITPDEKENGSLPPTPDVELAIPYQRPASATEPLSNVVFETNGLPIVSVTDVVKRGPTLVIHGQASFPAPSTADALIHDIVLGKEITDYEMFFDDDESEDGGIRDVDKGWAWVVLFGGFMAFCLLSGLFNAVTIYHVVFINAFGHSKHYTAWAGSLHCAFSFLGGPLSTVMILRVGCRWTIITGGLLAATGYLATSFAPNLELIFFTYGVITALGLSLNFSGWVIALGSYFNKKHSIATALAMTGFGCGLFFLGPVMEKNLDEFGWRGSLIINAGIALQFCVFGALVYPITFTGYMSSPGDEEDNFEKKFFKDWEETQSLPPPETERLEEVAKPSPEPVHPVTSNLDIHDEHNRKISTIGELRAPPASFMRPILTSTVSMDSGMKRTAFTYVPGITSQVSELRSKRTHSSTSIRSVGSATSSLGNGSLKEMRFSPAAAFLSHSIKSLTDAGQPRRGQYITVGFGRDGGSRGSNTSLPFLAGSRESVRSLDENFRVRSSSFRDELARKPAKQIYRKPQPVEDVENVAEDLVKTLNDPHVISLKPKNKKPVKGKKHKNEPWAAVHPKEQIRVPLSEFPAKEEIKDEEVKEAHGEQDRSQDLGELAEEQSLLSLSTERKEESSEMDHDEDDDDDEDESAEVWKLKATIKAAQRAQPPKTSFFSRFLASFEDNPRTISNIEEVDETGVGSLMSLNAIFRRKSREFLSKLGADGDSKKDAGSSCVHLPGIEEEQAKEKKPELPSITEEEEKRKHVDQEKDGSLKPPEEEKTSQNSVADVALSIGLAADVDEKKGKEEPVPEIGEHRGTWASRLRALWEGDASGDMPLFKDPRFWCFNYSGLVWIMGTLTLYVLYKDFATEKHIDDQFVYVLVGLGLGDLMGRLFSGTFVSWSFVNSVLVYALIQLACGVIILYHMRINDSDVETFVILCICLGVCYGMQNVLLAVAPGEVYGSSHLTIVFGYILFFCGIGAILGAPLASMLAQHYQSYDAAFIFAGASTCTGGLATLLCFGLDWKWRKDKAKARKAALSGAAVSGSSHEADIELADVA